MSNIEPIPQNVVKALNVRVEWGYLKLTRLNGQPFEIKVSDIKNSFSCGFNQWAIGDGFRQFRFTY